MIIIMLNVLLLTVSGILFLINQQLKTHTGQVERTLGLRSHKIKNHTPTMAGVAVILSTLIFFTFNCWLNQEDFHLYILLIIPLLGYGLIGFIDDFLILKKQKNDGVSPTIKFLLQLLIAACYFAFYLYYGFDTTITLGNFCFDLKFFYGILLLFLFSGFSNATNLTDGIDGLLGFSFVLVLIGYLLVNKYLIVGEFIAILISSLLAFLYFNKPKAKIFMGNTGALSLGAVMVSIAVINKIEWSLLVFGLLYILEVVSVVLQVSYFKITKGKRLFKMAPIHHHFEIIYHSEIKTLLIMLLLQIVVTILGLIIVK